MLQVLPINWNRKVFQAKVLKDINQLIHLGHFEQVVAKELFGQFIKTEVQIIHVKIALEGIQITKLLLVAFKFRKFKFTFIAFIYFRF
jgi:hypothetical protein